METAPTELGDAPNDLYLRWETEYLFYSDLTYSYMGIYNS